MKAYKIKNKTTGLYSLGSIYKTFGTPGKLWIHKSNLDRHLKMLQIREDGLYENCEVIEYDIVIYKVTDFENYEM